MPSLAPPTDSAGAEFERALELQRAGRLDEAQRLYRAVAAMGSPFSVDARINLGAILDETGRPEEALSLYREALFYREGDPVALNNMGATLFKLGRFAEAAQSFSLALKSSPQSPEIGIALGAALQRTGAVEAAIDRFRQVLERHPDCAEAHWNLALALLLAGRFREGWAEYQWRWRRDSFTSPRRGFDAPAWDGSPFPGRTLLVHCEQGFGDTIQFSRYLPMAAKRGGRVVVECQSPSLVPLLTALPGVACVRAMGEELPPFDLQVPLMSLPRLFDTTLENVPDRVPYLVPPPERLPFWQGRLACDNGFKVGVVWAGKPVPDPFRSCPLQLLSPLAGIPGVSLYSLQVGEEGGKGASARGSSTSPAP